LFSSSPSHFLILGFNSCAIGHCFTHFENNIPEKQKLFQEDNGIPAHLKGGVADALLYRATIILTVGGTGYAMYQLAMASFPKKQD
uniref:Cytochrome c oxidase subunit 7A2, mitochondrial n=1 Tax=Spermophilus dauricus TaxID=99837 RepID=A0A8C9P8T4_SPEDA